MVKVKPTENKNKISVKTNVETNIFSIKDNLSEYYAKQAENWAHSEGIVNGIDYSSKYYAEQSKASAQIVSGIKSETQALVDGFDNNVQIAKDDIEQNRINSINAIDNIYSVAVGDMQEKSDEVFANIETLRVEAIDYINSTKTTILNDIEFVADGEKKEIQSLVGDEKDEIKDLANLIKENAQDIASRTSFAMFDTILKDHILTYEETKGLALQGTYVYKEAIAGSRYGYPDFYNKVVEEYNQATNTETVNGITVKVHSNGHKFYDIADKTGIDNYFNTMGSAWFYGVDIENERVYLPRNNYFEQASSTNVGLSVQAGLPNITGDTSDVIYNKSWQYSYGVFQGSSRVGDYWDSNKGDAYQGDRYKIRFDASKSNSIYGRSSTVQPNAVKKLLYICVGNITNYEGMTEVVNQGMEILEQVANLIPENSSLISGYAMPSNRYTDLSLGASDSTYTAPANGYFYLNRFGNNNAAFATLLNDTAKFALRCCATSITTGMQLPVYIPCKKGDVIRVNYYETSTSSSSAFRFIYAEGEV